MNYGSVAVSLSKHRPRYIVGLGAAALFDLGLFGCLKADH